MTDEPDDYEIPLDGYEAALGNDLSALQGRIKELEATLRKLEYWFDTDQEILDVMGNNEKADHMRKLKLIRDTLTGGQRDE